jgi:hypothetical protein
MATLDPVANLIRVTLSTGYSSGATTVVLDAGQGALLPAPSFNMTWWNNTDYSDPSTDPNVEIIRVTNISTDTLTITRAQEGTSASSKNTAGKTYQMILGITAKMITDINNAINNAVVGYRTTYQQFTTAGSDTGFTLTPPASATATGVALLFIGGQQYAQGGGADYTVSGNSISLTATYQGGSGQTVLVVYTY